MNELSVPGIIGSKKINVLVTFPHGATGLGQIYIYKWFQGQIMKQAIGWQVYLNTRSLLSIEGIEVLKTNVKNHVEHAA